MSDPFPPKPDGGPLPYDAPPPKHVFDRRQFWRGLSASVFTSIMCFVMLFFTGAYYFEDSGERPRVWAWLAMAATVAALAVLLFVGRRARVRTGSGGFLAGVLLGIGLCALPLGMCFVAVGDSALGG